MKISYSTEGSESVIFAVFKMFIISGEYIENTFFIYAVFSTDDINIRALVRFSVSAERCKFAFCLCIFLSDKISKPKDKTRVITGLKRISKPGLRVYTASENVPRVLNGLGIAIISTSKGIMTDKQARQANLGGEVIAYIW